MNICLDTDDDQQSLGNDSCLSYDIGDSEVVPPCDLNTRERNFPMISSRVTHQIEAFAMDVIPWCRDMTLESRGEDTDNRPQNNEYPQPKRELPIERSGGQVSNEHHQSEFRAAHAENEEDVGGILSLGTRDSSLVYGTGKIKARLTLFNSHLHHSFHIRCF